MAVRKLESVDGFVVVDFADAPATGIVRRARKILQSSATDLARSLTYSFASFGIERSGASAGINATDDGAEDAIGAFVAVYFLSTGIMGLNFLGADSFVTNLFYGGGLVIAVAISQLIRGRKEMA